MRRSESFIRCPLQDVKVTQCRQQSLRHATCCVIGPASRCLSLADPGPQHGLNILNTNLSSSAHVEIGQHFGHHVVKQSISLRRMEKKDAIKSRLRKPVLNQIHQSLCDRLILQISLAEDCENVVVPGA